MIKKVLKKLQKPVKKISNNDALYDFVYNTTSAEKKKVLREVVKKVNSEQNAIFHGR